MLGKTPYVDFSHATSIQWFGFVIVQYVGPKQQPRIPVAKPAPKSIICSSVWLTSSHPLILLAGKELIDVLR